jgi:hypothetical protein
MCSQSVELASICTAAAGGAAQTVARTGCQGPSGLGGCELHVKPTAVHQQRSQLSRYDLDETEAAHRDPKTRQ